MRGAPEGSRLRVLHIVNSLGFGGAERLVLSAARGLPVARFDSAVCCLTERGAFAGDAEAAGARVVCIGGFPGLRHPVRLLRLVQVIRSLQPAIVHTHLQSANLYGRVAARIAGVPVIVATEHNVYAGKAPRYVAVERRLARSTAALIAVSEQVRQFLSAQLRVPPDTIRLIRNGVARPNPSADGVARLRDRITASGAACAIGTVASLTAKKGHSFLLEAAALLRDRGSRCALVFAGDGPERAALETLARRLHLEAQLHFLGNAHAADVYAAVDVFVLPSIVEGLPLALLEAMRAGTPAIATAVGGVPEVLFDRVNGRLVAPGSADALAEAIADLAASPERRQQYALRARADADASLTEEHYVASLAALYAELTA